MPRVAEHVRELLSAYADGQVPSDEWLEERLTGQAFQAMPPERLNPVLLELVPSRWQDGRGFTVEAESDRLLSGRLGADVMMTVRVTAPGRLTGGRDRPRIQMLLFTPAPGTAAGPVEASLRELLAAYAVGEEQSDGWLATRFSARFLAAVPTSTLNSILVRVVPPRWRGGSGLEAVEENDNRLTGVLGGDTQVTAVQEEGDRVRFDGLIFGPKAAAVDDERLRDLPVSAPAMALTAVREACASHGVVGASAAGADWAVTAGWLDLEAREPVIEDSVLCAYSISKLITTSVVLDLVARGSVELDASANCYLSGRVRLAEDRVTVRHLLSHTGGVVTDFTHFAPEVPEIQRVVGAVLDVAGEPGAAYEYSNAGFAALGVIVEDVTGRAFAEVVREVVFEPLGMTGASFPDRAPLHGYAEESGKIVAREQVICTVPSAGGMWCTAKDLVRFGEGWKRLLPEELVTQAWTIPACVETRTGLGWVLGEQLAGHAGGGTGFRASLLVTRDGDEPIVAMVNRESLDVERLNKRIGEVMGA